MKNPTDDDAYDVLLKDKNGVAVTPGCILSEGGGLIEKLEIGGITYDLQPSNCPRCDGDGIEPNPKSNHPRPRPGGGFDCYECGGEGKVYELTTPGESLGDFLGEGGEMPKTISDAMIRIDPILREGWWMELRSPFIIGGDCWRCGLTQAGATGWNGSPDMEAAGETAVEAIENVCDMWETRDNGRPEEEVEK